MLVVRGGLAFVVGIVLVNQPEVSASALVLLLGLWSLGEGAATIRQAYPSSGTVRRAEPQPALLVLGGVALATGVLAVIATRLSSGTATWVLAAGFAVRAVFECLGAVGVRPTVRALMGTAAVLDLGLVAVLVTHTTGSVADAVLFGGGLVALWGLVHLCLAALAKPVQAVTAPGPSLLSTR